MKKIFFLLASLLLFVNAKSQDRTFRIFDSQGKQVKFSQMIAKLQNANVVFFGEEHNNAIAHWLELKTAEALFNIKKDNLIIGAEMFEADNQLILDEYMHNIINKKSFEDECRLWPNYKTDYRPIIEFAKKNKIPFIATNIPRRYANLVYKKDFAGLKLLSDEAKKYIAPLPINYDPNLDCYKKMIQGMAGMQAHGSKTIAKAQAIKDATMAYFIAKNWSNGKLFFHFNGSYHSDFHQGICWHLKKYNPKLKIMTISTVNQKNINKLNKKYKNIADFIIVVVNDMTTTY